MSFKSLQEWRNTYGMKTLQLSFDSAGWGETIYKSYTPENSGQWGEEAIVKQPNLMVRFILDFGRKLPEPQPPTARENKISQNPSIPFPGSHSSP